MTQQERDRNYGRRETLAKVKKFREWLDTYRMSSNQLLDNLHEERVYRDAADIHSRVETIKFIIEIFDSKIGDMR